MNKTETQIFLEKRKALVEAQMELAIKPFKLELAQIEAGLRGVIQQVPARPAKTKPRSSETIPSQILGILQENKGVYSKDVMAIMASKGRVLSAGNTSAYLSGLKKGQMAYFDADGKWYAVDKKEPPEGGPNLV